MSLAIETIALPQRERGEAFRWSGSLVAVVALHALLAALALHWHGAAPHSPPMQSVTMIDLAPLPTPPEPPKPAVQPQPQPVEPPPLVKQEPKPVEKPRPIQRPVVTHPVPVPIPAPAPAEESQPQQAAPPQRAAPQPNTDALDNYRALLASYLARYKRYPHASQVKGEEGTVVVHFTLDRRGDVSGVGIDRGSGHPLLDEEVLALLRRAAPLPPLPASMPENERDFSVPVSFTLR